MAAKDEATPAGQAAEPTERAAGTSHGDAGPAGGATAVEFRGHARGPIESADRRKRAACPPVHDGSAG